MRFLVCRVIVIRYLVTGSRRKMLLQFNIAIFGSVILKILTFNLPSSAGSTGAGMNCWHVSSPEPNNPIHAHCPFLLPPSGSTCRCPDCWVLPSIPSDGKHKKNTTASWNAVWVYEENVTPSSRDNHNPYHRQVKNSGSSHSRTS